MTDHLPTCFHQSMWRIHLHCLSDVQSETRMKWRWKKPRVSVLRRMMSKIKLFKGDISANIEHRKFLFREIILLLANPQRSNIKTGFFTTIATDPVLIFYLKPQFWELGFFIYFRKYSIFLLPLAQRNGVIPSLSQFQPFSSKIVILWTSRSSSVVQLLSTDLIAWHRRL